MIAYTKNDVGCYADSTFGHDYVRAKLANLVAIHLDMNEPEDKRLLESLRQELPKGVYPWDEAEALMVLNEVTKWAVWSIDAGDLVLAEVADMCEYCHCYACVCDDADHVNHEER